MIDMEQKACVQKIRELTERLNRYRDEYYNKNAPSVADEVYDRLFDELNALEEQTGIRMANSPTLTVGYPAVSALAKTQHSIPLLSLDKIQNDVDRLMAFIGGQPVTLMLKLDGLTIKLIYENGNLVEASTRGDGNTGGVTGTGSFGWPCPGCYYVTSRMGNRFHPIFNEWRYHSGMDIGAGEGSAIVASDGGTISWCGEKGGYGNCIMIDHGNGYYTLYGHLSGYAVSYEQTVTKGQTIGYVGSSGWATGPHLHFEIRSGSTALDPEAVAGFSGLTYAADAGE
jgi:murein DD-endopeptidase MepM/ murein hydrolase activator NlpD